MDFYTYKFLSNWATDLGATTFTGESWHYDLETVNDELIHSTMNTWFSNNGQPNKYLMRLNWTMYTKYLGWHNLQQLTDSPF